MSYAAFDACLTRIREVLVSSAGTLRTVPSSRFLGDLPEGLGATEDSRRGVASPRVEASVVAIQTSPSSPPIAGNVILDDVDFEVRVIRTATPLEQLSDADRDTLRAQAAIDSSVLKQALGWPGNLTTTSAGTATGIVSGCLRFVKTSRVVVKKQVGEAQPIETVHLFRGVVKSAPATS